MKSLTNIISVGGGNLQPTKSVTFTQNGTSSVVPDTGYDGMEQVDVTVDVPSGGGSTEETWVWNEGIDIPESDGIEVDINFQSNSMNFSKIMVELSSRRILQYDNTVIYSLFGWADVAYRKITFATPPTGDLLTYLQTNAVKQETSLAVQPTKTVNITTNGTTNITPDVPYDVLEGVTVNVNVAT